MSEHMTPPVSYLDQSEAVKARFDRLKARDVVLEVKDLGKVYDSHQGPVTALKGVNFQVHRHELVCVLGPSDCGKSTLIRILAGLESYSSGQVLLDGQPVQGPGKERGMVFQGYTLFPWLTVKKNVMFGLEVNGAGHNDAEAQDRQWLELVDLTKFADAYPHQLSGGMKQCVAIARALAKQLRILLMDEPFGALDAQTRAKMQAHLLEIWRNIDITILFITHNLDEAVYLADRILVLKAHPGEVQELIEVPVPHPRSPAQFNSPEFRTTKAHIEALIHLPHEASEDDPEPDVVPQVIRLTDVGDDVE